jgi:hypothetical protein
LNNPACEGVIKEVLKNGLIKGDSKDIDDAAMNLLMDANIMALIENHYMFHSRIVERAGEQLYAEESKTSIMDNNLITIT